MIQDGIFYLFRSFKYKRDRAHENEAKTKRSREGNWIKKGSKLHFGYKLHIIIDRNYELIRKFKTTTKLRYDFQAEFSKKMKLFTETKDILEQNQKIMMQQWKEQYNNILLGRSDILRNKRIA